jgi:mannose-1-phosphate guanylyltransferase/mannose-6-phosphate isomerase
LLIPVILSGGAGTRLWPVSREMHPKPFIRLSDGESLLQKTLHRVKKFKDVAEVLTVTNRELYFKTKDEYSILSECEKETRFLLEPFGRNTAPAIGMAALHVLEKYGPESVLLILPADHLIEQLDIFNRVVTQAYGIAKHNKIVTFGIKPISPETRFGYIKLAMSGAEMDFYNEGVRAEKFVEKPTQKMAENYIASGHYLWNSGMFCFKAETILSQFKILEPSVYEGINDCWKASIKKNSYRDAIEIDPITFEAIPNRSIDYAIMEKAEDIIVIPCDFQWTDIGSWNAISELINPDAAGNHTVGDTLVIDSTNSFIQSNDRLVAALGVDNLMIVDTPDALLVANREYSQDVRKIVDELKKNNHSSYKNHLTVFRPWGKYTILEESEHFKIKRIVVKPHASLSLQMHYHRSEHWVVVSGVAKVTNGKTCILNTNESFFIPAGVKHRLENPGLLDLVLIEIQTGEYLGEDDIVRFDDKYGRVNLTSSDENEDKEAMLT